jgi:hypothetical protein
MDVHGGTPSRADRGVRCPTRPFVPPASIAGCDPARIVASRNPAVPASSNHLEIVVTVFQGTRARRKVDVLSPLDGAHDAAGRGVEDRVDAAGIATNVGFPTLEHRSVRHVNGRRFRLPPG